MLNIQNLMGLQKLWTKGWLTPNTPYALQIWNAGNLNPTDGNTYYYGNWLVWATLDPTDPRLYIPKKGIIRKCYIDVRNGWTLGTGETSTMSLLVTNPAWITTETVISSAVTTNNANDIFSNTGLYVVVNEWDYIAVKRVTPTWVTNPTAVMVSIIFAVEPQPCVLPGAKYVLQGGCTWLAPASGVTNYVWDGVTATTETVRIPIPYTGTATSIIVNVRCATNGTPASWSAEFFLRYNAATEQSIATSTLGSTSIDLSNSSLSVAVVAGWYLSLKITNPTRTVAPTGLTVNFSVVITI